MNNKDTEVFNTCDRKITIPKQLQDEAFRFCKVAKRDKKPFENGWGKKGYQWSDTALQDWLSKGGNYGVLGSQGDLIIFDADDLQRVQELGIIDNLPETFTIRTPGRGGWHLYFRCPGIEKKAALYDPEKTFINERGQEQYIHVADLVSLGMQAVGPSSIREIKTGESIELRSYEVIKDLPIATITLELFQDAISCLRTSPKVDAKEELQEQPQEQKPTHECWADAIHVENILLPNNIIRDDLDNTGELQGAHPIHGSDTGRNFSINIKKNTWYCHRCKCGGGPWELLAIRERIITCEQSYPGWKRDHPELWTQTIERARELGIKVPVGPWGDSQSAFKKDCIRYAIDVLEGSEHIKCLANDDLIMWNGRVYEYLQEMPNKGETDVRAMARKLIGKTATNNSINEVMGYFKDQPRTLITDFDRQIGQVVIKDGILDMATGELKSHNPDFLATSYIPIEWNPDADTSVIDKWMTWFMPDEKTRKYLWKLLGITVAGEPGLQFFHILYGEQGNNGKDTLLQILSEILGRQAWTTSVNTFIKDRFGKDKTFSLSELEGKKVIMATESERGSVLAEAAVKLLTGSTINARSPYGRKEKNFTFEGTSILATNHLPKIQGGITRPIKRRLRIIDCPSTLEGHGIPNFHKELLEKGGQGILRRIVEGYQAYLKEGLEPSEQMNRSLLEYVKEEDPLLDFVDSCLEFTKDETDVLSSGEIFEAWKAYMLKSGMGEVEDNVNIRRWFGKVLADQIKQRKWDLSKKQGSGINRGRTVLTGLKLKADALENAMNIEVSLIGQDCTLMSERVSTL